MEEERAMSVCSLSLSLWSSIEKNLRILALRLWDGDVLKGVKGWLIVLASLPATGD